MHFIFLLFFELLASADAYLWNPANAPSNMDINRVYNYSLEQLPVKAELVTPPWSETYWATYKGSINYRWNSENPSGYNYRPPTREKALKMSDAELRQLAPSEKYDLLMGRYDYPLFWEARSYSNPRAQVWSGICDGWSVAATQYPEPAAITLINPDGIAVPFGSSDIKGLMSFAAAIHFKSEPRQVGLKCGIWPYTSGCSDINAGSLHVIFSNQIGIKQEAFVTEINSGREIWNQPTYGYEVEYRGTSMNTSGEKGILVHAVLHYTDELEESRWDPVVGTSEFKNDKLEMDYILDLDQDGKIIGGTWINSSDKPDFVWLPTKKLKFDGYLSGINLLIPLQQ